MITVGNVTTFQFCTKAVDPQKLRSGEQQLIIVWFDGEPEMWAATEGLPEAMLELKGYYWRDWRGTKRLLPMMAYPYQGSPEYRCIQC